MFSTHLRRRILGVFGISILGLSGILMWISWRSNEELPWVLPVASILWIVFSGIAIRDDLDLAPRTFAALGSMLSLMSFLGFLVTSNALVPSTILVGCTVGFFALDRKWPQVSSTPPPRVIVNEDGVRRIHGSIDEFVRWEDLVEVGIITTSGGPFVEDMYWLLFGQDDTGCAIPNEFVSELLPVLQRLPGFDNEAVIQAACCIDDASFTAWRGSAGDAQNVYSTLTSPDY